ncbi:MAG: prephenate dehydrogenase/arogenate dehydrogenase family protein [Verrucomicrobiales bacterium]|jgi:prephenate dehydrogenase|nr:prephenate dehydrogenase/arogenate dehydrogenase family protein [Verrucomicrobiales bacterium]
MNTVTVIAPGLLGGSILKTLRRAAPATRLKVYARREATRLAVSAAGLADTVSASPAEAAADSDLVILCTPVHAMRGVVEELLPALAPSAIVTDVGSVKAPVHAALAPLLAGRAHWIGSHPMAGAEQSGLAAARDNLFADTVTILTPAPDADRDAVARLRDFWATLGARALTLTPARHDELVAEISHLPHLLAALLVSTVSDDSLPLAGPGFRDATRIAASPPELWSEILQTNRAATISALEKFQAATIRARAILIADDHTALTRLLTAASARRRKL